MDCVRIKDITTMTDPDINMKTSMSVFNEDILKTNKLFIFNIASANTPVYQSVFTSQTLPINVQNDPVFITLQCIKQYFGPGTQIKNYCITENSLGVIKRDIMNEAFEDDGTTINGIIFIVDDLVYNKQYNVMSKNYVLTDLVPQIFPLASSSFASIAKMYITWLELFLSAKFPLIIIPALNAHIKQCTYDLKAQIEHEDPMTKIINPLEVLKVDDSNFIKEMCRYQIDQINCESSDDRYTVIECTNQHEDFSSQFHPNDDRMISPANQRYLQVAFFDSKFVGSTECNAVIDIDLSIHPIGDIIISNKINTIQEYNTPIIILSFGHEITYIVQYKRGTPSIICSNQIYEISLVDKFRVYLYVNMQYMSVVLTDIADNVISRIVINYVDTYYTPYTLSTNIMQLCYTNFIINGDHKNPMTSFRYRPHFNSVFAYNHYSPKIMQKATCHSIELMSDKVGRVYKIGVSLRNSINQIAYSYNDTNNQMLDSIQEVTAKLARTQILTNSFDISPDTTTTLQLHQMFSEICKNGIQEKISNEIDPKISETIMQAVDDNMITDNLLTISRLWSSVCPKIIFDSNLKPPNGAVLQISTLNSMNGLLIGALKKHRVLSEGKVCDVISGVIFLAYFYGDQYQKCGYIYIIGVVIPQMTCHVLMKFYHTDYTSTQVIFSKIKSDLIIHIDVNVGNNLKSNKTIIPVVLTDFYKKIYGRKKGNTIIYGVYVIPPEIQQQEMCVIVPSLFSKTSIGQLRLIINDISVSFVNYSRCNDILSRALSASITRHSIEFNSRTVFKTPIKN